MYAIRSYYERREVVGRLGEERGNDVCDKHRNMVIFPNSVINDQQSVLVRSIIPLAHNRMLVRAWTLGPKDESVITSYSIHYTKLYEWFFF